MTWFRFYVEALEDPKVQRLAPKVFKGWVNLLCLAKRCDGELPAVADIAFALRASEAEMRRLIETLTEGGLLDETETGLRPHNWNTRQYKSDVSTERVKRFRDRSLKRDAADPKIPPETLPATPPESDSDSDSESKNPAPNGAPMPDFLDARPKDIDVQKAFHNYNIAAEEFGLARAEKLTEDRRKRLRARLGEHGLKGWNRALEAIGDAPFLRGENERGWRASLDFLLQPANLNKVLEGTYGAEKVA